MFPAPSDTLVLDTAKLHVWQQDGDFDYGRELMPYTGKSLGEWLQQQIDDMIQSVFGNPFYQDHYVTIWTMLGTVAVISYFVYRTHTQLFSRSGTLDTMDYQVTEDTIYGVDFQQEIAKAMDAQNYRDALRWMYLQTLKALSDAKLIDWQPFKTPTQYTNEWKNTDFRKMTQLFAKVRYGGFVPTYEMAMAMKEYQKQVEISFDQSQKGGQYEG